MPSPPTVEPEVRDAEAGAGSGEPNRQIQQTKSRSEGVAVGTLQYAAKNRRARRVHCVRERCKVELEPAAKDQVCDKGAAEAGLGKLRNRMRLRLGGFELDR